MTEQILTARYEAGLVYAAQLHATQCRKGGDIPYLSHLLAVSSIVIEHGGNEDEAIAALLHDGPEDQGGLATLNEIRERFGDQVADIVEDCSDTFEKKKPDWADRKKAYIAHVVVAGPSTQLVSMADKLHNARSILMDYRTKGEDLWTRFNGGREGTLWYYRALVTAFSKAGRSPLFDELDHTVSELESAVSESK
jgi:GTP pyrophosphokinase